MHIPFWWCRCFWLVQVPFCAVANEFGQLSAAVLASGIGQVRLGWGGIAKQQEGKRTEGTVAQCVRFKKQNQGQARELLHRLYDGGPRRQLIRLTFSFIRLVKLHLYLRLFQHDVHFGANFHAMQTLGRKARNLFKTT